MDCGRLGPRRRARTDTAPHRPPRRLSRCVFQHRREERRERRSARRIAPRPIGARSRVHRIVQPSSSAESPRRPRRVRLHQRQPPRSCAVDGRRRAQRSGLLPGAGAPGWAAGGDCGVGGPGSTTITTGSRVDGRRPRRDPAPDRSRGGRNHDRRHSHPSSGRDRQRQVVALLTRVSRPAVRPRS